MWSIGVKEEGKVKDILKEEKKYTYVFECITKKIQFCSVAQRAKQWQEEKLKTSYAGYRVVWHIVELTNVHCNQE